ncbi:MAG: hypothetical protein Q9162_004917 [Coniocarpon cinnabarinum]
MTFARHLALRRASQSVRARPFRGLIRRSLASDTLPTAPDTTGFEPPIESLFVEERKDEGLREDLKRAYYNRNTLLHTTAKFGSEVEPHHKLNDVYVNPPLPSEVSVESLIASQTHFGHSTSLWHPANSRYIFGVREGIHIISSDITAAHLRRAAKVVSGVAERAGIILFVGTRKGHERTVVRAAELAGAYHLFDRWVPGTITNGSKILERCTAHVVDEFDRKVEGFENQLAEHPALKPDLVVCLNPLENYVMLHECGLANIPTIGIVDTDINPTWVTYPIPANDDSLRSVALIACTLGRAGHAGQLARRQAAVDGKVSYLPPTRLHLRKKDENNSSASGSENEGQELDPLVLQSRTRMGHGTNFFESGRSPRDGGTVLGSSSGKPRMIGSDQPLGEDAASEETRATPGKGPTLASDRDLRPPDQGNASNGPARQAKREDSELEQGGSQAR